MCIHTEKFGNMQYTKSTGCCTERGGTTDLFTGSWRRENVADADGDIISMSQEIFMHTDEEY